MIEVAATRTADVLDDVGEDRRCRDDLERRRRTRRRDGALGPAWTGAGRRQEAPSGATGQQLARSDGAGSSGRCPGLAIRTQPEQLEPVVFDPEPPPAGEFAHDLPQAGVLDLRRAAAARTHDVVVVGGRAGDVCVLAVRQVEPLDDPELGEQVEGAEQRRATDAEPDDMVSTSVLEPIRRREVSVPSSAISSGTRPTRTG